MGTAVPRAPGLDGGPTVDDKYELLREIGRGGMGVVYEARNTWTHRRVALKILHPGLPRAVQQRLFEEARTAARLVHPNVVDVLDMGAAADGSLYLVQALLEGEDLHARLDREGRLAPHAALEILRPVVDALAYAHERGVVHRDVKPSNIVLATNAHGTTTPTLVDFGIAKLLDDQPYTRLTADGTLIGTPHYMAPEQIVEEGVGAPADVWAIGICLHEALTGRVPFESTQIGYLLREIPRFDATSPRLLVGVHDAIAAPIRAALQVDPARRPSMRDLGAMLARAASLTPEGRTLPPPRREPEAEEEGEPTIVDGRVVRATLEGEGGGLLETGSLDALGGPEVRGAALRIGLVITSRDVDALQIRDAFHAALERRCEITRFRSYAELVDAIGEGEVDLAWLPPVAYVRAARMGAARLLVSVERSGRAAYASALLVRRGLEGRFDQLRGRRAVWVDGWSAAGYLVPRALMRARGLDPDLTLASQGFVGSYDAVLDALTSGAADVGATFCTIGASGEVVRRPWSEEDGLVPIAVSAPIPGDTFCASPRMPDGVYRAIRLALTDSHASSPLVRLVGASRLAPGDPDRYRALERALVVARSGSAELASSASALVPSE